jgi:HAD superfamily hydrolase (TIGR01458 family)
MPPRYDNVLIDLAGVLYQGEAAIPGAVDALGRLRAAGCGIGFVTNTTRRTAASLVGMLTELGFELDDSEVLTAAGAARQQIDKDGGGAHFLVHPDLMPELADLASSNSGTVVVGDAGEHFTYASLNQAFRVLMAAATPRLIAMGDNRYFADGDALSLDMGPFVQALAYAAGIEPSVVGKPAKPFFEAALHRIGAQPERTVMIGDDMASDIGGAQRAGIDGVLVRTGKYRPEDEHNTTIRPAHVADDIAAAVAWLVDRR